MPATAEILRILADGRFHSGEAIARALGVSRGTVWKRLHRVGRQFGVEIQAVRGRGYRLAEPIELLDADAVRRQLGSGARSELAELELHMQLDSTNRHLMRRAAAGAPSGTVCLAEFQTAGRGRRGRSWVSPFAGNVYLSVLWRFAGRDLSGVSLALAVAVVRALDRLGLSQVGLKWPNDVLWRGRKLAGVLLEMAGEASGPCHVVAGIGLNVRMGAGGAAIDQPWVDLETALGRPVERSRAAAMLIEEALRALADFEREGLAPFLGAWRAVDLLCDQPVAVHLPARSCRGIARGVDASGALLLEAQTGLSRITAGEVSVRQDPAT